MSFGDATSRTDVELGVNLGRFRAEMGEAGQVYNTTTGRMSKDSLRAAISHEKLLRAINRSGPESLAAKSATLAYRREMEALNQTSSRTTTTLAREERQLERLARGSLSGAGALGKLRGAAVFASTSFLGGYGLTYALRSAIGAASTLQEETEKTGVVFGKNADDVQAWSKTLALSFGVSEDAALKAAGTFGNMLRPLHFGEKDAATMSKRLVELAADMASFNNVKPDVVLQALSSGLTGQVRPLRQYGVFLSQTRIQQEAYADGIAKTGAKLTQQQKVQAAYNIILKDTKLQQGDVARNTGSLSVAQSKFTAELQDGEAVIARDLLPELTHLVNTGATYLDGLNKSGQLQRDANHVFHEGALVAHGLARGLHDIKTIAGPLVGALGGTENAAKLMIEGFAVYKLAKIAAGIRSLGLAARFSRREITLLNETPVLPKGSPGLGGPAVPLPGGASGRVYGGVRGSVSSGAITRGYGGAAAGFLAPLVAGYALAYSATGEASHHVGGPLDVNVGPGDLVSYRDPVTGKYILMHGYRGGNLKNFIERDVLRRHPELARPSVTGEDVAQRGAGARTGAPSQRAGSGQGSGSLGLIARFNRADLALSKATAAGNTAAERQALEQQRRIINEEISSNKKAFADKKALYDQLAGVNSQIDAIDQAAASKRADAERKSEAAERKREAAERKLTEQRKAATRRRREAQARQRAARIDVLTNVPLDLRIEEQTAIAHGASESKLLAIYRQELKAIEQQIPIIRRLHLGKQAIYDARRNEAAIQKKITGLKKKTGAGTTDLLDQAAELERLYGSNVGRRNDPLSPQDALGLLGELVRLTRENTRHAATTAKSTQRIGSKGGVDQITMARALAGQGL